MQRNLRTYIYYSDDKIRELDQQLPLAPWWRPALNRVRGGGVSVADIGGNVAIGEPEAQPILRTMQAVWRQLVANQQVGTFDEPEDYFYGRLEFYYGLFDSVKPPVLFLVGATDQTIVALGGSQEHVRGHRDREIRAAENAQSVTMEPDVASVIYTESQHGSPRASPEGPTAGPGEEDWAIHVAGLYTNWQFNQGTKMEFEVLARQERRSRVSTPYLESPRDILIGSPIFVAQI
jgi:hypothetical protein